MEVVEDIIGQAVRLAIAGGVGLPVVILIILGAAVLLVIIRGAKGLRWPTPAPEEPPPPPAEWGDNVTPPDADHPGGPGGGG